VSVPLAVSDAAAIGSTLGAALVGAMVGGFLTSRATRKLEQDRREHQDERERRAVLRDVRALALVEVERWETAQSVARVMLEDGTWLTLPHPTLLAMRPPEQRLLLAQCCPMRNGRRSRMRRPVC
jgi:hypothetical protein